jgi:transcriptional regulator with PAS, ATPase and Fis domain
MPFLDEVSKLTLELQARLLRVLQEHGFERMGGTVPVRVHVRVIATTNRNLAEHAATGLREWRESRPFLSARKPSHR